MKMDVLQEPLGAFCRETHVALAGAASGLLAGLEFGAKDVFLMSSTIRAPAVAPNGSPAMRRPRRRRPPLILKNQIKT